MSLLLVSIGVAIAIRTMHRSSIIAGTGRARARVCAEGGGARGLELGGGLTLDCSGIRLSAGDFRWGTISAPHDRKLLLKQHHKVIFIEG